MRAFVLALTVLVLRCSISHAQERWELTDIDFSSSMVELLSVGDDAAVVRDGVSERHVPIDRILRLRRESSTPRLATTHVLHLHGGGRLPGTPLMMEGESLRWRSAVLGEVVVPLREARGVCLHDADEDVLDRERSEDVLRLRNGDIVRGITDSITQKQVVIQTSDGRQVQAPVESVQELLFAPSGEPARRTQRGFAVATTDGSRFISDSFSSDGTKVRVKVFGGEASLPMSLVAQVEQVNGAVTWLSDLEPVSEEHIPYLGIMMPARMDRSVSGGPIRAGGKVYDRGIGVHSRSVLVFALDGGFRRFRTAFAIDGNLPLASVDVRILADDKELFARKGVRAGEAVVPQVLSVEGARRLTLEVDFGENFDVQDRVVWIEPALLR